MRSKPLIFILFSFTTLYSCHEDLSMHREIEVSEEEGRDIESHIAKLTLQNNGLGREAKTCSNLGVKKRDNFIHKNLSCVAIDKDSGEVFTYDIKPEKDLRYKRIGLSVQNNKNFKEFQFQITNIVKGCTSVFSFFADPNKTYDDISLGKVELNRISYTSSASPHKVKDCHRWKLGAFPKTAWVNFKFDKDVNSRSIASENYRPIVTIDDYISTCEYIKGTVGEAHGKRLSCLENDIWRRVKHLSRSRKEKSSSHNVDGVLKCTQDKNGREISLVSYNSQVCRRYLANEKAIEDFNDFRIYGVFHFKKSDG